MVDPQFQTRLWQRPELFIEALRKRIAGEPTTTHQVLQVRISDLVSAGQSHPSLLHFYNAFGPEACAPIENDLATYFRTLREQNKVQAHGRVRDTEHDLLVAYLLFGSYDAEQTLSQTIVQDIQGKIFGGVTLEPRLSLLEIAPGEKNLKGIWQTSAALADHAVVTKQPIRYQRWAPI